MNTTDNSGELSFEQLVNNPFDENRAGVQRFNNEEDSRLHVRFYLEPVEQTARSIKESRRIFEDTEFIEIMIPGDKLNIIKRQVWPIDKQRFAQQYARFKQGLADQTVGTPLSELVFITASKVKEYEFFGIKTIEQLAGAADGSDAGQRMMGFNSDKQKANAFLAAAKGNAPINELRAKLDERDNVIEAMQRQMQEMNAKLEAQSTKRKAVTTE
ncbi:MAG: hypothetical protein ACO29C_07325 [Fluviibacter sp.]